MQKGGPLPLRSALLATGVNVIAVQILDLRHEGRFHIRTLAICHVSDERVLSDHRHVRRALIQGERAICMNDLTPWPRYHHRP